MNRKASIIFLLLLAVTFPMWAQGEQGIRDAATKIKEYIPAITTLMYAIGGVVGLVGGIRVYVKWNNGDQDVNKELMMWGGALIFLLVVPTVITAFFT
ncbi:MAG: DUF4134 family protein [Bacteroidia bacterium]|nr:DUF4134 family protein [Bacteroidia bacterium]